MIYTSYFAKPKTPEQVRRIVSIANSQPNKCHFSEYFAVIPSWNSIVKPYKDNIIDQEEYTRLYKTLVLSKLNPDKVATDLEGRILCCWESSDKFCHRHLLAEWFRQNGYECIELT